MEELQYKIFIKDVGQIYLGRVVDQTADQYTLENLFMVVLNVEQDGPSYRINTNLLPLDTLSQKPAVMFRAMVPGAGKTAVLHRSNIMQVLDATPELIRAYLAQIERIDGLSSGKFVESPKDEAKVVKLFPDDEKE